jgi:hypothetical protein
MTATSMPGSPASSWRSVVDPDVDTPESLRRCAGQRAHGVLVAHVGRHDEHVRGASRAALAGHGLQARPRPGREHECAAAPREAVRGGASDPARGAGEDDDRLVERAIHAHRPG